MTFLGYVSTYYNLLILYNILNSSEVNTCNVLK